MEILTGKVNKIVTYKQSIELSDIDLVTSILSFSIDDKSFKIEANQNSVQDGDELVLAYNPKNFDVYYWINKTRGNRKSGRYFKYTCLALTGFFFAAFFFGAIFLNYEKAMVIQILFVVLGLASLLFPVMSFQEFYCIIKAKKMIKSIMK